MKYKKVTVLNGYYATGDDESFCFGKASGPDEHYEFVKNTGADEYNDQFYFKDESLPDEAYLNSTVGRVYIDDLLPELKNDSNRYGNWKITVEFEETEPNTSELNTLAEQIKESLSNGTWQERVEAAQVLLDKMKTYSSASFSDDGEDVGEKVSRADSSVYLK